MSTLSSLSTKLGREEPQYRKFTLALIALRAQSRGYATKLGLQEDKLEENRKTLIDFVARLREALDQEIPQIDLRPLLRRMKDSKKPMQDWRKDLDALTAQLQLKEQVTDETLAVLEDVQSLLAAEFTHDLRRLSYR